MRKSKFSEEQIINILKSADRGQKVGDVCRRYERAKTGYFRSQLI